MKAIPTIPLHRYHTISTITLLEIMALRASHYGSRVQGAQRRSPRIAGAIHAPRMRCDKTVARELSRRLRGACRF